MRRSKALRRALIREEVGLNQPAPAKRRWYETSWFKGLELASIIIGVGAITYEVWQRETVDRPLAEMTFQELIATAEARARVTVESSTASIEQKQRAIEELAAGGHPLSFLRLSCGTQERMNVLLSCALVQPAFSELQIEYEVETTSVQLSAPGLTLSGPSINGLVCDRCDFDGLIVEGGRLQNTFLGDSNLRGASLFPSLVERLALPGTEVSQALFNAVIVQSGALRGSWYWSGQPPGIAPSRPWPFAEAAPIDYIDHDRAQELGMNECPPMPEGPPAGVDGTRFPDRYGIPSLCASILFRDHFLDSSF